MTTTETPQAPPPPNAEEIRAIVEQARAQAREQIEAARAAREAARDAAQEAAAAAGNTQVVVQPPPFPFEPQIPQEAVVMSIAFFITVAVVMIGVPIARAIARRLDRKPYPAALPSPEVTGRLDRIEQAVDAIALEVERISEGQRFTTKIMSELRPLPAPDGTPALEATMLQGASRREATPVRDRGGDR